MDNFSELARLEKIAGKLGKKPHIMFRIKPGIDAADVFAYLLEGFKNQRLIGHGVHLMVILHRRYSVVKVLCRGLWPPDALNYSSFRNELQEGMLHKVHTGMLCSLFIAE